MKSELTRRIVVFVGLISFLIIPLISACSALPDSAKSKRMIADEIYDCLDSDTRAGMAFMGGKDRWLDLIAEASTKDELIAERERECRDN